MLSEDGIYNYSIDGTNSNSVLIGIRELNVDEYCSDRRFNSFPRVHLNCDFISNSYFIDEQFSWKSNQLKVISFSKDFRSRSECVIVDWSIDKY